MTREAALACGKSVPIGNDTFGRSYWVFSAEPTSLFVCQVDPKSANTAPTRKQWHMFRKPEEIASVMVCMGQSPLCDTLKQVFPEATKMLKDRSWSTLLFARRLGCSPKETAGLLPQKGPKPYAEEQIDYGPVSIDSLFFSVFITAFSTNQLSLNAIFSLLLRTKTFLSNQLMGNYFGML